MNDRTPDFDADRDMNDNSSKFEDGAVRDDDMMTMKSTSNADER